MSVLAILIHVHKCAVTLKAAILAVLVVLDSNQTAMGLCVKVCMCMCVCMHVIM